MNKKIILVATALLFVTVLCATTPGVNVEWPLTRPHSTTPGEHDGFYQNVEGSRTREPLTTTGERDDFYQNVEWPRHPAKDHLCLFGGKLYTENGGTVYVRDADNLSAPQLLFACTSGTVSRIHVVNHDIMFVETTSSNTVHGGMTCGFEVFSIGARSTILVKQNGSVQGFRDGRVYFMEYSEGRSTGQVFDLGTRSVTATSLPEGKLVFNSAGALQYVINRGHTGLQTVYTGAGELIHTTEGNNILLGVDDCTGSIFEARYHRELGRWLPWVTSKDHLKIECIFSSCPGNIIYFESTQYFDFFSIRMADGLSKYELVERHPSLLGNLIKKVLPYLNGSQVTIGPEFEQLQKLDAFHLVTVDSIGALRLLHVSRTTTGVRSFASRLLPKLVDSEVVTVTDLGSFKL